ncbi:MAG: GAF domain-containing protein [Candidatus Heimdallarchaeota archaeon]|nr:GAF domain-containing protein [Candidatus Heimdallarchaeota archaeon]
MQIDNNNNKQFINEIKKLQDKISRLENLLHKQEGKIAALTTKKRIDIPLIDEETQKLLKRQTVVNKLALELADLGDIERIFMTIYDHIVDALDISSLIICDYNEEDQTIKARSVIVHWKSQDVSNFPEIPLGEGPQSYVIKTARYLYVPDYRKAVKEASTEYVFKEDGHLINYAPNSNQGDIFINTALFIPMKIKEEVIGVMQAQSIQTDAFSEDDITLLSEMANISAIPIKNAQLFEIVKNEIEKRKEIEILKQEAYRQLEDNIERFFLLVDRIRNPLTVILGIVEMGNIENQLVVEEQIENIVKIMEQIEQGWQTTIKLRKILSKGPILT